LFVVTAVQGSGAIAVVDDTIPTAEITRANLTTVANKLVDTEGRIR
jgi:hypothetical protein